MYQSISKASDFWQELSSFSESAFDSIPTLENQLDGYFERNAASIIEEWGLLTDDDLRQLRMKIEYLSYEVGRLAVEKNNFEKRTIALKAALDDLERNR